MKPPYAARSKTFTQRQSAIGFATAGACLALGANGNCGIRVNFQPVEQSAFSFGRI